MKIYDKAKIDFENFKKDIEEYTKDKGVIAAFEEFAYRWNLYNDIISYIQTTCANEILKNDETDVLQTIKNISLKFYTEGWELIGESVTWFLDKFCE